MITSGIFISVMILLMRKLGFQEAPWLLWSVSWQRVVLAISSGCSALACPHWPLSAHHQFSFLSKSLQRAKQTTQQEHLDQCCQYYGHGHLWPHVTKMKSSLKSSSRAATEVSGAEELALSDHGSSPVKTIFSPLSLVYKYFLKEGKEKNLHWNRLPYQSMLRCHPWFKTV